MVFNGSAGGNTHGITLQSGDAVKFNYLNSDQTTTFALSTSHVAWKVMWTGAFGWWVVMPFF